MSPTDAVIEVSRWFFAFLGVFSVLAALGWLHAEKKARRELLRSAPGAGTIGELMVLSGSDELPVQTWFPVTREGVLGSVRSCDLVIPCPGVKAHHLDYVWKDGTGLIIRPRSGCEALIDGVRLDCRSDAFLYPLTHGSCLQVGQAILRLQVLKALDPAYQGNPVVQPQEPAIHPEGVIPFPAAAPSGYSITEMPPVDVDSGIPGVHPEPDIVIPGNAASPVPGFCSQPVWPEPLPDPDIPAQPASSVPSAPSRRRSENWREDWSE